MKIASTGEIEELSTLSGFPKNIAGSYSFPIFSCEIIRSISDESVSEKKMNPQVYDQSGQKETSLFLGFLSQFWLLHLYKKLSNIWFMLIIDLTSDHNVFMLK